MAETVVIIGAGIVGLHCAAELRNKGFGVYVLDKETTLGEHTSGRNSGVIHAGIFYTPGSFKETVCIEGNRLTYEWLQKLQVPFKACGKWVVPEPGQEDELEAFFEKIRSLPIPTPFLKSVGEIQAEEPQLRRTRGILVPSTGIVDAATYLNHLVSYLEERGVSIIPNCEILAVHEQTLVTPRGAMAFDWAINSAGLQADHIAHMTGVKDYTIRPCRGDYYLLASAPLHRPVYHLPYRGAHGLGVHLTPTLDQQTLIGPNAFFIDEKEDYHHRSDDPTPFEKAVRFFLPNCPAPRLNPAYSGNRPKLFKNDQPVSEFTMLRHKNWLHLLGIESPGLTAAPALAKHLLTMMA